MLRSILLLAFFIQTVFSVAGTPLTNAAVAPGDYAKSTTALGGQITINWNIEGTVISVAVTAPTAGWVAIGFGSSTMTAADIYLGSVTGGTATVLDYYAAGEGQPSLDTATGGTNGVLESAGVSVGGTTTIKFRRNLAADNAATDKAISPTGNTPCIVAYGTTATLAQHAGNARIGVTINFASGQATSGVDTGKVSVAHSVMMVLAWLFFATGGIFIARFGHAYKWWFKVHIIVMTTATVFSITGFVLALFCASAQFSQTTNVALAHAWIGLLVVVAGVSQPIVGFIADRKFNPNRSEAPLWPDKVHWYLGRYAYIGALINILIGMIVLGVNRAYFVLYGIYIIGTAVFYHMLDVGKGGIVAKIKGEEGGSLSPPKLSSGPGIYASPSY